MKRFLLWFAAIAACAAPLAAALLFPGLATHLPWLVASGCCVIVAKLVHKVCDGWKKPAAGWGWAVFTNGILLSLAASCVMLCSVLAAVTALIFVRLTGRSEEVEQLLLPSVSAVMPFALLYARWLGLEARRPPSSWRPPPGGGITDDEAALIAASTTATLAATVAATSASS